MALRSLYQFLAILLLLAHHALAQDQPHPRQGWLSPEYSWIYEFPLPIPPIKEEKWPKKPIYNPVTGKIVKYYEVEIKSFTQQIYPNLNPTSLIGYDGMAPGPTFWEEKGTETVVRFTNHGQLSTSVHLHGSYSRAPFDGWAEDLTQPGQFKDYFYPNLQSGRTLWYHDHAVGITAVNAYYGQIGTYVINDPADDWLGLPSGYGKYDIPLVLASKQYNSDGSLYSPSNEYESLYGDVIEVNGQPWPYFKVEPRRYRFRILNAAVSRSFMLYLESNGQQFDFYVVASDAGLLTQPTKTSNLLISMGERYEVVINFSSFRGQNVDLLNTFEFTEQDEYQHTDKVMRFVVGDRSRGDSSRLPSTLREVPWPTSKSGVDHRFVFDREGGLWRINGITFMDVQNRVLAKPDRGLVEVWQLENHSRGSSHPIHLHLVDFRIIERSKGGGRGGGGGGGDGDGDGRGGDGGDEDDGGRGDGDGRGGGSGDDGGRGDGNGRGGGGGDDGGRGDGDGSGHGGGHDGGDDGGDDGEDDGGDDGNGHDGGDDGGDDGGRGGGGGGGDGGRGGGDSAASTLSDGSIRPYESAGLKDVVWLGPGETVMVEAHYSPWPGVYMFHCHNLIHEDHMMMAAFNVSTITDLGYNETNYDDPMDQTWRPKQEDASAYEYDAVKERMDFMCSYQPYDHANEVDGWLSSYWATKTRSNGGRRSRRPPAAMPTDRFQGPAEVSDAMPTSAGSESGPMTSRSEAPEETQTKGRVEIHPRGTKGQSRNHKL